ncbi:MAG TPA: serine/threonine-protein kinase, partial [Pyrinomonadaceae bacterium]|nr:serine/threonine-protein kinase [Pyrinomonadaceae bacterium]
MDSERWQKIKGLFDVALEIEPEKRSRFLKNACADDVELRLEVEKLLDSFDTAESFMEHPAAEDVASLIIERNGKPESGERFAHYEIVSQIGEGGMGEVYLAKDTRLNRKVALKLLAAHITEDKNRVSRFRQEAFATSALNHPNIVTIYEIGEWQGRDFIVTEFIEGVTLRSLLRGKKLSLPEMLDIAVQITSALTAAHGAGIIHRDIKPENVMIRSDGLVKVLDFGIAKYTPPKNARTIREALIKTKAGEVIGTAAYMSPEQARGLETDARTDIWSLGVILYEMIARKLPFQGSTRSDRIAAILEHEPAPIKKFR